MENGREKEPGFEQTDNAQDLIPDILEEIEVEDLTVDGICGVY